MASSGNPKGMMAKGPPYVPMVWSLGGTPKISVDVPVTAVFLFLYICGAAVHMTIFQMNRRRGRKFLISVFIFGFCMARIATCTLRIASTCLPTNIRLAIAASIFVAAGVLIIFIVNLIFTQRIIRSMHPHIGWHTTFSLAFKALYVLIIFALAMVITVTVQSLYTLRPRTRTIDRDVQLYAATFLTIISFLPIPLILISLLVPRRSKPEKFGAGRLRTKITFLLLGSAVICLGAAFRCGTSWKKPVPRSRPLPAYYSKACFYVFNFAVEIVVVYLYAIMRIDLRFHVPNGSKGPGDYRSGAAGRELDSTNGYDVEKQTETEKESH